MPESKNKIYTEFYQTETKNYKKYLDILGLKPETTQARYLYLKEFFSWLESKQLFDLEEITSKELITYQDYLHQKISQKTKKKLTSKSIFSHLRTIQFFFNYLLENKLLTINSASFLKFSHPQEKVERFIFSQEEIQELYEVANLEERIILHLGYGCGLRVMEINQLDKEDLRLSENILVVQKGKNSKRRLVPMSQKISDELQLAVRFERLLIKDKRAILLNNKGLRMKSWTINLRFKKLLLKTDFGMKLTKNQLNRIGIHSLRHSIATHLLENGMKLEHVQKFLGHAHVESTEIYTHITQNQVNSIINEK